MNGDSIKQLSQRFKMKAPAVTAPFELPTAVVEIQPDFVAGIRLASPPRRANGSNYRLRSLGVAGMSRETLAPLVDEPNISNPAGLGRALQAVAGKKTNGAARFGLLPDGAVRVGILSFEALPENRKEAQALMRRRIKEVLPFPLEEARISHQTMAREGERIEVLALAAKSSVLADYERALELVNAAPAVVLASDTGAVSAASRNRGGGTAPNSPLLRIYYDGSDHRKPPALVANTPPGIVGLQRTLAPGARRGGPRHRQFPGPLEGGDQPSLALRSAPDGLGVLRRVGANPGSAGRTAETRP